MEVIFLVLVVFVVLFIFNSKKGIKSESSRERKLQRQSSFDSHISEDLESLHTTEKENKKRKATIQNKYKIMAKFYKSYKFIDYADKKSHKTAKKQMADIVNILDKNLFDLSALTDTEVPFLIVGMITFKHVTKEQVVKVNNDLAKLYKMGLQLNFNERLMTSLEFVLPKETESLR